MIDAFSILVSCLALAFVIRRAIKLDRKLAWFEPTTDTAPTQPVGSVSNPVARGTLKR